MPRTLEKQLKSKRPGGFRRWFRRISAALLLLIFLTGGAAWITGRMLLDRVAEALRLDRAAEIEVDRVLALPLLNVAYGRNLTIQLRGGRSPARVTIKKFRGAVKKNESGDRIWAADLDGVRLERGAGALSVTRMSVTGSYDRAADRLALTDGLVDYLVFSGRKATTSFTRLAFKRLAFDVRAARLALGRAEGGDWTLLDLFWQVDQARLEYLQVGLSFLGGYETPRLNLNLTGYNNEDQWALVLDATTAREAADDLGDGHRRSLSGLLNKAAGQNLDMARLLRFDRLRLSCGGAWADGPAETGAGGAVGSGGPAGIGAGSAAETAASAGERGQIWTESVFLFPRLFTMTVNGLGPAASRAEAAGWLAGCFSPTGEADGQPRCLAALGFDSFTVDYGDRGLTFIMRPIKSFRDKIFGETDPSGPLGPPALGLALGLWLDEQDAKVPAGTFAFKPAEEGRLYPFRREFFTSIKNGSTEIHFSPPGNSQ